MDGGLRIRDFKVAVLILKATLNGRGITPAEIARASGAPLETSRRYVHQYQASGDITVESDPEDDRATRVRFRDPERPAAALARIVDRINEVDWRAFNLSPSGSCT